MFNKLLIKKNWYEYASFDIAILFYVFQFYFYVQLFGHPMYQSLSFFFVLYFLLTSILLFFTKNYKENNPVSKLYVDLYFVISLPMLLISRVIYSTLNSIQWQALFIPIFLMILILYRLWIHQKVQKLKKHIIIFKILSIMLNIASLLGLFVHMMFYQG